VRISLPSSAVVFFFQAEDGIRDYKVTGVQTCALPICGGFDGVDAGLLGVDHLPGHAGAAVAGGAVVRAERRDAAAGDVDGDYREIGRASCRERGEMWGGGVAVDEQEQESRCRGVCA